MAECVHLICKYAYYGLLGSVILCHFNSFCEFKPLGFGSICIFTSGVVTPGSRVVVPSLQLFPTSKHFRVFKPRLNCRCPCKFSVEPPVCISVCCYRASRLLFETPFRANEMHPKTTFQTAAAAARARELSV
jgi:hypothetical protein